MAKYKKGDKIRLTNDLDLIRGNSLEDRFAGGVYEILEINKNRTRMTYCIEKNPRDGSWWANDSQIVGLAEVADWKSFMGEQDEL